MTFPDYLNLGPETTKLFATGLLTMPNLQTFDLSLIKFDHDSFFLVMSELGQKSQVRTKRGRVFHNTHNPYAMDTSKMVHIIDCVAIKGIDQ